MCYLCGSVSNGPPKSDWVAESWSNLGSPDAGVPPGYEAANSPAKPLRVGDTYPYGTDQKAGSVSGGSTEAVYGGAVGDSGNVMLEGIIWGDKWNNAQPITYFFDDAGSSSAWTVAEKAALRAALDTFAHIANLTFQEVFTATGANLVERKENNSNQGLLGEHQLPNGTDQAAGKFNENGYGWNAAGLQPGGLGFSTIVHELGHALGLAHPQDSGGGSTIFPGVTADTGSYGDNDLNQSVFTVMSYNHGWITGTGAAPEEYGDAAGPMAFDIAALQFLYGANPTFAGGADTYTLPTANGRGTYWTCIWDTGGTDTIVHNGTAGATINLVAAPIDNVAGGGGNPSYVDGIMGGFTIARNAVIENASGGSGSDVIVGNAAANTLSGNDGADNIFGAGGNDVLNGGVGADFLYGDAAAATSSGVGMGSGTISNPTGNVSIATALDITNAFSVASNANIAASTTRPHVTISATTAASGSVPSAYFAVTVAARSTIYIDVDDSTVGTLDSEVFLYNSAGTQIAYNDDSAGDAGSLANIRDSAVSFTVATAGTYYIEIDSWELSHGLVNSASYQLHISVADPVAYGADGPAGADTINGGAGNDTIDGGAGIDSLVGGADDDTYYVDTSSDVIVEAVDGGTDTVISADNYIFHANVENVTLTGSGGFGVIANDLANVITGNSGGNGITGGGGNDTISGGAGNDVIDGQTGSDSMSGGTGSDVFFIDVAGDVVSEVAETDVYDIVWTLVSYTLPEHVEILILNGALAINGTGNDGPSDNAPNLMLGNNAANTLTTFGGKDIILGLDGNDIIIAGGSVTGYDVLAGGRGSDTMTGATGHDYFSYANIDEAGDTITDFTTTAGDNLDILDLRAMFPTFTNTVGVTTAAQAVASGHLTFTQAGADTQVFADADGGANGNVLLATLQNTTASLVQNLTLI